MTAKGLVQREYLKAKTAFPTTKAIPCARVDHLTYSLFYADAEYEGLRRII